MQRLQDLRLVHHVDQAGQPQGQEPDHDDRTEHPANQVGPVPLHEEQRHKNAHGDGHDIGLENRRDEFEPFHGPQNGNGWRDGTVTVEQRRTEHAKQQQARAQPRAVARRIRGQGRQGQASAFATIVGAQHQQHVFQGDNQHQGPEDRRSRPDDVRGIEGHAGARAEDLLHRIERAGANIAVDDPDRPQRQCREPWTAHGKAGGLQRRLWVGLSGGARAWVHGGGRSAMEDRSVRVAASGTHKHRQ